MNSFLADSEGEVVVSLHARARCMERGISERMVEEAVRKGREVRRAGDTAVYQHGRLRVVVSENGLVVTCYRMPKRNPKRWLRERRKRRKAWS